MTQFFAERTHTRRLFTAVAVAAACAAASGAANAQGLTEAQARVLIAPLYANFSQPRPAPSLALLEQATSADWQSCSGEGHCRSREVSAKVFEGFGRALPDMKHQIREVLVAGDRVVVRGDLSGTPSGDFFGVAHSGRSFKNVLAIDVHTIRDGRIAHTWHVEDWADALAQLRAK